MRRLPFISFMLLMLAFPVLGQSTKGEVTGRVTDATGAVIQRAAIQLDPSGLSTTSDALGEYIFPAVPPGAYTLKVTSIGFTSTTKTVTVAAGQTLHADLTLDVASSSEQVVVSAESGKDEIQAINQEITAPNILQVMPETQILSLPNANVADAIGRMPGVTVQRDEGEAVYVQVRGLDPRLTNTTIDGVTIPSPESNVRQVILATIPADMVQSIELNKTLSANQDADGIGGSVNMVTKMAGEAPTFNAITTLGMSPIENDRYMGLVGFTLGKRFSANKRWGVILGASYDYNGRGYNDIEPTPDLNANNITSTTPYYDSIDIREYRHQRLRWGGTMGADYKLTEHSTLNAHLLLSDFKDWGDKWTYTIQTDAKPKFKYSIRRPDFMIGSLSLGGSHVYGNKWFTWGSSVSRSRELDAGGNPGGAFDPSSELKNGPSGNCDYVGGLNGDPYLPQWSPNCMTPNTASPADNLYSLSNYTLDNINTTTGQAVQLNLQEWGSMGLNYHIGKHPSTLELGGEFRNAHKGQNAETPTFDYCPNPKADPGYPTSDPCSAPSYPSPVNSEIFASGFQDPHYYGGSYHMGETTNHYKVDQFLGANPGLLPLDVPATRGSSDPANYNLIERVTAGYIMNTLHLPHLNLQTGLRIEATHEYGLGNLVNPAAGPNGDGMDNNGNWIGTTPVTNGKDYIDPLPSVQARYAFTNETAVRAVYARGISRPNQYDLVPYAASAVGPGNIVATIGNPNELPTHANNYDLLLEQQLKPFGLIQAGFFYKQLTNPIVAANVPCITSCTAFANIAGVSTNVALETQDINGSNANVWGLEFGLQQRYTNLPGAFRGLGLMANYSYNDSHISGLPDRDDSPSLMGTARHAFNIEPDYEYRRYSVHLGVSYNASNIDAYQYFSTNSNQPGVCGNTNPNPSSSAPLNGPINGPCGDNYFYPHFQVDAQMEARIYRGLRLQVQGLNLNNEVFGFYNGSEQYMTQREYYKPTYEISLRWNSGVEK
ncbi:MAG: TonB-dependent receptor [Terracidiphilus sp.]